MLVSIISEEGSTPRKNGTKMVVAADGRTYGTVGGSLLEANAIARARRALKEQRSGIMSFDLFNTDTSTREMICGGKVELLLDYLPPTAANRQLFRQMKQLFADGKDFYYLTGYTGTDDDAAFTGHCLALPDDGLISDDKALLPADIAAIKTTVSKDAATSVVTVGGKHFIVDFICRPKKVYCFGAGHVAVPTAHIAALAGFAVTVVDDRIEFANAERFPEADLIMVRKFAGVMEGLDIDANSFLIILTRGHQFDRVVLEQALGTLSLIHI